MNHETAVNQEQNSQQAFEMVETSLKTQIANAQETIDEKKTQMSKSQESSSQKQSELDDSMRLNTETQKYLDSVTAACEQKAREFKERTKLRSDEITAVQEATTILTSAEAQRLSQKQSLAASFLQTKSTTHKVI